MSRYTNTDALIKAIRYTADLGGWIGEAVLQIKRVAIKYIENAPSIDIVRCGECKHWKSTVQMPNGTEVKCLYGRKADDFCSYGSRSEKPNNLSEIPTGSERSSE